MNSGVLRPFKFSKDSVNKMVRKTWLLFLQWERSEHDVDRSIYEQQRELTQRMLETLPQDVKEKYPLP